MDYEQMTRIGVAVPVELRDQIAKVAASEFHTTSSWMRRLVTLELEARKIAAEREAV